MPKAYKQLREITTRLEKHYKDIQDFEFTIQDNTLYMLQTRNGKRTGVAAVHIAVDLVEEGILTQKEAVGKVEPQSLDQLLHPIFDLKARAKAPVAAKGLPASPGAATGAVVFTADDAVTQAGKGKRVVLVRMETVPDDIHWHERGPGHPHRHRRHDRRTRPSSAARWASRPWSARDRCTSTPRARRSRSRDGRSRKAIPSPSTVPRVRSSCRSCPPARPKSCRS
jgi:hypothetical protein